MNGIISTSVQMYQNVFSGYLNQFLVWGQWLFYGFLTIAIVWLCLWRAFDHNSFQESMPNFLKEFFIITFFYTIMLNCGPWLGSIVQSATDMGSTLAGTKVDPSNIISDGIALGNLVLAPAKSSGFFSIGIGTIIAAFCYVIVLATFFSIALDLALTIIVTSFLISISALFLAFSAFPFTRVVARNSLDVVISNSFKLLGLYAVVAAGQSVINQIASIIPTGTVSSFDIYGWVVAASLLFWLISRNLPNQIAKIVTNVIQESRGTEAAAMAMAATQMAKVATKIASPVVGAVGGAAANLAKIAGSAGYNAAAHFSASKASGGNFSANLGAAAKGSMSDLATSAKESLSDRFTHLASKMSGGEGIKARTPEGRELPIPGVANRMHQATQLMKSDSDDISGVGNPSSSGLKSAAPSKTRSQQTGDKISRPKK